MREYLKGLDATIQTQLTRRQDLYHRLQTALDQGTAFESRVFEQTQNQRQGKGQWALGEAQPQVQSAQLYQTFQREISLTETLVQQSRETYNREAQVYNGYLQQIPRAWAAGILGFHPVDYKTE